MISDFNQLVADVARANVRCERAAALVLEARIAEADAVAELVAAEDALNRAVSAEVTSVVPRRHRPPLDRLVPPSAPPAAVPPPTPIFHRRCSMCRGPGHHIQTCPEVAARAPGR
ncbi:MAG: hypothetical protein PVS2B1_17070 [Candidatus Dormibacteraceae bacterium]